MWIGGRALSAAVEELAGVVEGALDQLGRRGRSQSVLGACSLLGVVVPATMGREAHLPAV
jgi:hypothetical protein